MGAQRVGLVLASVVFYIAVVSKLGANAAASSTSLIATALVGAELVSGASLRFPFLPIVGVVVSLIALYVPEAVFTSSLVRALVILSGAVVGLAGTLSVVSLSPTTAPRNVAAVGCVMCLGMLGGYLVISVSLPPLVLPLSAAACVLGHATSLSASMGVRVRVPFLALVSLALMVPSTMMHPLYGAVARLCLSGAYLYLSPCPPPRPSKWRMWLGGWVLMEVVFVLDAVCMDALSTLVFLLGEDETLAVPPLHPLVSVGVALLALLVAPPSLHPVWALCTLVFSAFPRYPVAMLLFQISIYSLPCLATGVRACSLTSLPRAVGVPLLASFASRVGVGLSISIYGVPSAVSLCHSEAVSRGQDPLLWASVGCGLVVVGHMVVCAVQNRVLGYSDEEEEAMEVSK
ncbi:hypothetical protein KIPB_009900 [Kipferlia bialata]|uniref:Uncharacterized protein n=1 Tax=Kipferlia bialata TaxID=797122 RepID=A0A9K3D4Z1_9EUKA|nr:hypothetical protein KIPB_009900 [Kipferlia bialata]|eukprot:g9900.t1